MLPSLTVIVPSSGRNQGMLERCLASFAGQLREGDELLVGLDPDSPWGYSTRERLMRQATGDAICFMDDDDIYLPGALDTIRQKLLVDTNLVHVFRMRFPWGDVKWSKPVLEEGQIASQITVVPNIQSQLGRWGDRYQGDFDFAISTARKMGGLLWHSDVICEVRPGATEWKPGLAQHPVAHPA